MNYNSPPAMSLCHKQPFLKSSKWAMKRGPWARVSRGWIWDYTVNKCEMCFSCDYLENFSKIYYCLYFRTSQNWICSRSPKKFYTVKLFRIYFFNSSIPIPKCGRGNNVLFPGILAFSQANSIFCTILLCKNFSSLTLSSGLHVFFTRKKAFTEFTVW